MSEIDWNVELRKIEREYDGLPPAPSPARLRAERAAEERKRARADAIGNLLGAWARLLLVAALAASLWWWPWGRACGSGLAGFVGASGMVAIGGLWAAIHTWRHRLAASHAIAMALLVAGLALATAEVLPRFGWATFEWVSGGPWACDGAPVASVAPVAPAAPVAPVAPVAGALTAAPVVAS